MNVVSRKVSTWKSVPRRNTSWKEAVWMELPFFSVDYDENEDEPSQSSWQVGCFWPLSRLESEYWIAPSLELAVMLHLWCDLNLLYIENAIERKKDLERNQFLNIRAMFFRFSRPVNKYRDIIYDLVRIWKE